VAQYYRRTFAATELALDSRPALDHLRQAARAAQRVFVDIDCDVLDPTCFPAVTQPVPFGLSPALVLQVLDAVWSPRVAGVMLSEFDPARDRNDQGLALLVWLIEYLLLRRHERT
jgi:arginase family enzyme